MPIPSFLFILFTELILILSIFFLSLLFFLFLISFSLFTIVSLSSAKLTLKFPSSNSIVHKSSKGNLKSKFLNLSSSFSLSIEKPFPIFLSERNFKYPDPFP